METPTIARDFESQAQTLPPATGSNDVDVEAGTHRANTGLSVAASVRSRKTAPKQPMSIEDELGIPRPITRSATVRNYHSYTRRHWEEPGAEPGVDPYKMDDARFNHLRAECRISVLDFSPDNLDVTELDNEGLISFLEQPRENPTETCRWINVNGLSWDVISALGRKFKLHRLAIEDLMKTRGRTKTDWYSDHAFVLLTLQKLVRLSTKSDDNHSNGVSGPHAKTQKRGFMSRLMHGQIAEESAPQAFENSHSQSDDDHPKRLTSTRTLPQVKPMGANYHTLQRYRGVNFEREVFMERNSALTQKNLGVSVEQVSLFLMADNTLISVFEHSADEIQEPILKRLLSLETIIRRSADASLMLQAVLDAIIDLAIPLSAAYEDIIAELELEVLTDPALEHSRSLYILSSELATLRNNVQPIASVIAALRDHRKDNSPPPLVSIPTNSSLSSSIAFKKGSTVAITPTAHTYLADVEDHCLTLTNNLENMRRTTADMISLIFNSLGAFQNESMKQLTAVTIFFLPLTFLTGYFGQNFHVFTSLDHSESYFWEIAIPVSFVTILVLMKPVISRFIRKVWQKMWIRRARKVRREAGWQLTKPGERPGERPHRE